MSLFKNILCVALLFFMALSTSCNENKEDGLRLLLKEEISQKEVYQKKKEQRIKILKDSLLSLNNEISPLQKYSLYNELYDEYILFRFDSAYYYANLLKQTADILNTPQYLFDSRIKYCQALYNAGYYKEALDSLSVLEPYSIDASTDVLTAYYLLYGRMYHMLANTATAGNFPEEYNNRGNEQLANALQYATDSVFIYMIHARIASTKTDHEVTKRYIQQAINLLVSNDNKASSLYAMLAQTEYKLGNIEESLKYHAIAAIIDIQNVTKEGLSLINVANILSVKKGEIKLAADYLSIALQDAREYGASQRIKLIDTILPVIRAEQLELTEKKRSLFFVLTIIISILLLGLVMIFIRTIGQSKKLSEAQKILQSINKSLSEVNMIKNEYLGHYLVINSELSTLIDRLAKVVNRSIKHKNYNELATFAATIQEQRENLYEDFDRIFLKIFPTFIEDFNNLVEEPAQIHVPEPNTLTPTLRIFALIRLNITDSATISKILNYSLNTIYNYRTRIKNHAVVDKDNFEQKVKEIGL